MDTSEDCALRGGQAPAGQVWVEGYTTSRGVRVEGHFRAHQRRTETAMQPDAAAVPVKVPAAGAAGDRPKPRLVMAHSPAITTAGAARDEMDTAGEVADGSGSGRCPMCGQYAAANHDCPARPDNLPEANYKGIPPKDRVEVMLADLDQSVQAIVESGQLEAWLDVMASNGMSRWSANNRLLAIMQLYQRGDSLENVHLMGFKQWKEFGRSVNDGAKAVWVLAPVTRRLTMVDSNGDESEERRVVGFRGVAVFNISDTHGKPLAKPPGGVIDGDATPGTYDGLRERVALAGYNYSEEEILGCRPAHRGGHSRIHPAQPETGCYRFQAFAGDEGHRFGARARPHPLRPHGGRTGGVPAAQGTDGDRSGNDRLPGEPVPWHRPGENGLAVGRLHRGLGQG